jgi:hypothetical protein
MTYLIKKLDRGLPDLDQDEGPEKRPYEHPELQIAIGHGVVSVAPPIQLIDTLDDGGVLTFTTGAENGVPPVVVVVVVVVGAPPPPSPPFVGALASARVFVSLEQALVTEGAALHVGQAPPPDVFTSPPSPPQPSRLNAPMRARDPSLMRDPPFTSPAAGPSVTTSVAPLLSSISRTAAMAQAIFSTFHG